MNKFFSWLVRLFINKEWCDFTVGGTTCRCDNERKGAVCVDTDGRTFGRIDNTSSTAQTLTLFNCDASWSVFERFKPVALHLTWACESWLLSEQLSNGVRFLKVRYPVEATPHWRDTNNSVRLAMARRLEEMGARFPNVEELDLANNTVTSMSQLSFRGWPKLRVLDISRNMLSSLTEHSFIHLDNLENLRLSRNWLRVVSAHAFKYLSKLRHLDLSRNEIEDLPDDVFCCSPGLFRDNLCHVHLLRNPVHRTSFNCSCRFAVACPASCPDDMQMADETFFNQLLRQGGVHHLFRSVGIKGTNKCISVEDFYFPIEPMYMVAKLRPCDPADPLQHLEFGPSNCADDGHRGGWLIMSKNLYLTYTPRPGYPSLRFERLRCTPNVVFTLDGDGYVEFAQKSVNVGSFDNEQILTSSLRGKTKFVTVAEKLSEADTRFKEIGFTAEANNVSRNFWTADTMEDAELLPAGNMFSDECRENSLTKCTPARLGVGTLYFRRHSTDFYGYKCAASVVRGDLREFAMYEANNMIVLTSGRCVATNGTFHSSLLFVPSEGEAWDVSYVYTFDYDAISDSVAFLYIKKNAKNQPIGDVTRPLELKFDMLLPNADNHAQISILPVQPSPVRCTIHPQTLSAERRWVVTVPSSLSDWFPVGVPWIVDDWLFGITIDATTADDVHALFMAPFDHTVKVAYTKIVKALDGGARNFCL